MVDRKNSCKFAKYKKENKMTKEELENYEPKGEITGFPKEIIARMLECQEEQGNKRDISVLEGSRASYFKGFKWYQTEEGYDFWDEVILRKNFDLFFEKYPKICSKCHKKNKMTKEELENYEPKGQLEGFPKEIIARMVDCQEEQGNPRDINVFEKYKSCSLWEGGFDWEETKEDNFFWYEVICNKDFDLFFKKYPKQDNQYNSQEFKIGDEVIDIITGRRGKVTNINTLNKDSYPIFVKFNDNETAGFTLDGRYYGTKKYPILLHYRDDYDYSVIDFNNLPKRQEANRWRAEVGEKYYYLDIYFEVHSFLEEYSNTDTKLYKIGNYFQTKEQAQEVANKLNKYFNQLINK